MSSSASLAARTVFLRLYPTPRTFSERREVLRVLERFGEVSMFKSHQYSPSARTPSTFAALFASATAAGDLINASPIRYRLISQSNNSPEPSSPAPTAAKSAQEALSPETTPIDQATSTESETLPQESQEESPFQLHAFPSTFNHTLYLTSPVQNPLHGPYTPIPPSQSYIGSSLAQIIPQSMSSKGLLDWETDGKRLTSGGEVKQGEMGEGWERDARFLHGVRERTRLRGQIPRVMDGLRPLRREWVMREEERMQKAVVRVRRESPQED